VGARRSLLKTSMRSARQVTELLGERGVDVLMSRPGQCSLGPKPSVHSSRPRPDGIVVGLAAAGISTRSSNRSPSPDRRDHQTDRAQPHRDPRSTSSLPGPYDHSDQSATPRRVRGRRPGLSRRARPGLPRPLTMVEPPELGGCPESLKDTWPRHRSRFGTGPGERPADGARGGGSQRLRRERPTTGRTKTDIEAAVGRAIAIAGDSS
jgi:hypothetical protein